MDGKKIMIEFIICDDNREQVEETAIFLERELAPLDIDYKIRKFYKYNAELKKAIHTGVGNKVYILDIQMPNISGLDMAREIRDVDRISDIIMLTGYPDYRDQTYTSRLSILDFVVKDKDMEENLRLDLDEVLRGEAHKNTIVVKEEGTIHQIQYKSILYIAKITGSKHCEIICEDDVVIETSKNISSILEELDSRFVLTHRSCIVNTDNVQTVSFSESKIVLKNGEPIYMLSRKKRKELEEKLVNR